MSDLERAIVGGFLQKPKALLDSPCEAEWFADEFHRRVFGALAALVMRDGHESVSVPMVVEAMGSTEPSRVWDLYELDAINLPGLVKTLRKHWQRRVVSQHVEALRLGVADPQQKLGDVVGEAVEKLLAVLSGQAEETLRDYGAAMKQRAAVATSGELATDILPSGFLSLDRTCGGLPRGGLVVVGGRPGRGKSALLQQFVEFASNRGERVLLASPEMSWHEVGDRALARQSGVWLSDIRQRQLNAEERMRVRSARPHEGIWLYDAPRQTTAQIAQIARRVSIAGPLSLIAVDYVQYLADRPQRGEQRYELIGRMARSLKALARALDCVMVVGAQLKRPESERDPRLADLRESGDLEQDADLVLLLCEPEEQEFGGGKHVRVLVEKNRQGPVGVVTLGWHPVTTEFVEVA